MGSNTYDTNSEAPVADEVIVEAETTPSVDRSDYFVSDGDEFEIVSEDES